MQQAEKMEVLFIAGFGPIVRDVAAGAVGHAMESKIGPADMRLLIFERIHAKNLSEGTVKF